MSSLIVKVSKVYSIKKHPDADRLSIVTMGDPTGWSCIVGLDQYKPGDLVVYVPPDCVIPDNLIELYKLEYLKKNGRTGTVKLRGYVSQGLILDLPEGNWKEGDDVAEVMGITKYEQAEASYSIGNSNKTASKKKLNPLFDKYTDIENIKNYTNVFEEGEMVFVTEKVHGCNGRWSNLPIAYSKHAPLKEKILYFWKKFILKEKYEFVYGSHNVQLTSGSKKNNFYGTDVWGKIAEKYNMVNIIPEDTIIYGEVYGKGIQDLTYGLEDIDLVVFDVKVDGKYMSSPDLFQFCEDYDLPRAPLIFVGRYDSGKILEWTDGKSLLDENRTQIREGCVIKPLLETNNHKVGRKVLKSVSLDYLTRKNGTEFK